MKYKNYKIWITQKKISINNYDYIKWVVELKSKNDYVYYLVSNLNLITENKIMDNVKKGMKILCNQFKSIVDKRITEKTIFKL
tara:strand:- start:231 stop:479 length:249 start_codon:yes stop_codon:yes gene_type:complete